MHSGSLLLGGVLGGGSALVWAQTITISPSLTLSEEYDDNILLSPTDRQGDFVTSVSPGLRLAITAYPVTATDTLVRSLDPGEVDPTTGITVGRFVSTRNTVTPAVSYQLIPLTHLRLHYAFSVLRSDSPLAEDSDTPEAGLFLQREFIPRTTGTFRYTFNRFEVEGTPARDAHLPRVGLAYALSPTIRLSADAGPLLLERADGSREITAGGSVNYAQEFEYGRLSLTYDRTAGVAGALGEATTSQGLTGVVSLSATRAVTVALEGGVRASEAAETAADFLVYTAGIRLDYRILRWLSLSGGYRYLRQDNRTGPLNLERTSVFLGLTASTDARVY